MNREYRNRITPSDVTGEEKTEIIEAPFRPDEEEPYIFISYAHADKDRVFPIIKRIYEKGWHVWYDEGLFVGNETDYADQLAAHIRNCAIIVVFVTKESVQREFVTKKELEFGINKAKKRVVFCRLDRGAKMPDGIELLTANEQDNPRTNEAGLEYTLNNILGLKRFAPRKAVPYKIEPLNSNDVIEAAKEGDEYDIEKCKNGIRLTKYNGSAENVVIPQKYKGHWVVELSDTFFLNEIVKTVRVPETVRKIGGFTFSTGNNLKDVYIPASVQEFHGLAFHATVCNVHCAENTEAHRFAKSKGLPYVLDPSLNVTCEIEDNDNTAYAFCSYAADKKIEAQRIIKKLIDNNCSVVDSGTLSDSERNKSFRNAQCLVAFISREYTAEDKIDYLYRAIEGNKDYIIYALDNSELPNDISISKSSEQQLRFDKNEETEISKLVDWLDKNNCGSASADISDFEYTRDKYGNIILTKYTGSGGDVVIPREHAGNPVIGIDNSTFYECHDLVSVTIPGSVVKIGDNAFWGCDGITSITIPDSVKSVGSCVFDGCRGLVSVTIPDSLTSIVEYMFCQCRSLVSVAIPDSVTSIGEHAFYHCNSLKSIAIPNSVKEIGEKAFGECGKLTVYCNEGSEAWRYCEQENIPYKPLEKFKKASEKTSRRSLSPLFILLALLAAAAGVQFSGLFDILGWLGGLL